jgi:type IV pilus assembly protein PilN
MVRINLLPVRAERKKQVGQQQLMLMGLAILAVIVVLVVWVGALKSERRGLETRIAELNEELKKLDQIIGEVKQYTETKAALEGKLKIIDDLKKGRSGPVKVLDDLAQRIPKKVWIKSYDERDKNIVLTGQAVSDDEIASFMHELQQSQFFKNISLKFTRIFEMEGNKYKDFVLECQVTHGN